MVNNNVKRKYYISLYSNVLFYGSSGSIILLI